MAEKREPARDLLDRLPSRDEILVRITENAREKRLLQQLLKLAEQRERLEQSEADVKRNQKLLKGGQK